MGPLLRCARWGLVLLTLALVGDAPAAIRVRGDCQIVWQSSTTYTDGTPGVAAAYRLYTSTESGAYGVYLLQVPGTVTQTTCTALELTTRRQTSYVVVTAVGADGIESAPSNELAVQVAPGRPRGL